MEYIKIYVCVKCGQHLSTVYPSGEDTTHDIPSHCGIPALVYERLGGVVMRQRVHDWKAGLQEGVH